MNILILDSWLREHLKTEAKPEEIGRYLSLSSQSVERTTKTHTGDFIYNIEVTSNRPDAFSVYGIARELSAVLPQNSLKTKLLPILEKPIPPVKKSLPLTVKIIDHSLVPRFTALVFDNVQIKPPPKVVQERLEASGIRSLNNVIDISNYLMLELGQPMHTFDYDKISKAKMIVRQAKAGEKITTLDGQVRLLPAGTIIIEDGGGRIIDLCGIMGGKNSEVDENTQRVLLFVQTYDPVSIRRSCQGLAFRTEAASRFEKGIDPEGVIIAMKRAVGLFKDWCGAKVASQLFDIYPEPPKPYTVSLKKSRLDQLLGVETKLTEAQNILESLGFETQIKDETIIAKVPHWRYGDITLPEDLVEEIARIHGYHNLPNVLPPISFPQKPLPILELEDKLKTALQYWGLSETPTYSLTNPLTQKKAGISPEGLLRLANPLSEEWRVLRTSLLPSLLEVVAQNIVFPTVRIFEIANVYLPQGKSKLPDERSRLGVMLADNGFLAAKGLVEIIFDNFNISNGHFIPPKTEEKIINPQKTADILVGKELVGRVGEVSQAVLAEFGINRPVAFLDLDLAALEKLVIPIKTYQPVSKYPPIIEDFSFVVPPKTLVAEIVQSIKQVNPLIISVELIDIYDQTRTFRIIYQSKEKSLTDKEIVLIRNSIINRLEKDGVRLKGAA
ncbi:MAG TPA: phenylalanine--tRNA ligase subunit beta [Patescibacteria group bacterium]|nr:phenylalanine--tRNA ligase subunit beta [Patescibacteria group bacterium]